jgi:hypothetical protein
VAGSTLQRRDGRGYAFEPTGGSAVPKSGRPIGHRRSGGRPDTYGQVVSVAASSDRRREHLERLSVIFGVHPVVVNHVSWRDSWVDADGAAVPIDTRNTACV